MSYHTVHTPDASGIVTVSIYSPFGALSLKTNNATIIGVLIKKGLINGKLNPTSEFPYLIP